MLYIQLLIGHTYILMVFMYDFTIAQIPVSIFILENILLYIEHYYIFIYVMLMFKYGMEIKYSFYRANKILTNFLQSDTNKLIKTASHFPYTNFPPMKAIGICKLFSNLGELVDIFNKIFGYHILLLTINIVMEILQAFDKIVVYTKNVGKSKDVTTHTFVIAFLQSLMLLVR